ncbi:magnesium and cobalt transport protein CorA [Arenimonas sp. GDDSR-1]|uniref:magnesium and cobalt transport protein CorA n=1 Tax=Arenimonas sp. GDDSR-1 TaxID=2950125 RepID=UPI002604714C|nr:magnesium and cobalt transport protein CorA [Arenimonas sp. GDDSR-1]
MDAPSLLESRSEQIRFIARYDRDGNAHELDLDRISDALGHEGGLIWVGLFEPDETLLFKMQVEFDLHPLAIEDAHKAHQRSKIERFGNSLFIVVNTAQMLDGGIVYGESHLFLGTDFILTVRHGGTLSFSGARERCAKNPDYLGNGTGMALYTVLDQIVDNFFPIIAHHEQALDELEEAILSSSFQKDTIIRLYRLRTELTKLRLAVSPLQDIMTTLLEFHGDLVREEVRVYLRDVHDHVIRLNESIDTMRDTLSSAMATNLSLVTVSQGDTMKRLAGWAALLAAPTLITSWYGMNFADMPELEWQLGYPLVGLTIITICFMLYRGLKKAGWL